jgi:hypothetical protein
MDQLPARVRAVLGEYHTLVLATVGVDGTPEAASVFYAPVEQDGLTLVCALLSSSNKLAHLRNNPRAGIFIGPREPTRWLQATAAGRIVEDAEERERRLAQLLAHAPAAGVFVERVPVTPVVFRVSALKLTDLTGAGPPIETLDLGAP